MWTKYPDYKHTVEDWIAAMNDRQSGAHTTYCLNRALRRAARDKVITREEQKSLWSMIVSADDEDHYVALKALETKYKLTIETYE